MSTHLSIQLFGSPAASLNNKPPNKFPSKKAQGLLFYLALNPEPQARDFLARLLWPDELEPKARRNLNDAIWRLKKDECLPDVFQVEQEWLGFQAQVAVEVDCVRFMETMQIVGFSVKHPNALSNLTLDQVTQLISLIESFGKGFLPRFRLKNADRFNEWLEQERQTYQVLAAAILLSLAQHYEEERNYKQGLVYSQKLVDLSPTNEDGWRQLMKLLALNGQRIEAARQYKKCRAALLAELDLEPSPETQQLFRQIKANKLVGFPVNLPASPPYFVGREADCEQVALALTETATQVVTVMGVGGVGKTRMAVAVAHGLARTAYFAQGVYFVPLDSLEIPRRLADEAQLANGVATAIAEQIGFVLSGERSASAQLAGYLRDKQMLLVLDNFEHLLPAGAFIAHLTQQAPNVKILVTSRERLRIQDEILVTLQGLAVESPSSRPSPAVDLFLHHLVRVNPKFRITQAVQTDIERICQTVAGLPLGIELAASWVRMLSVQEVLARLVKDLGALPGRDTNTPTRHHSLTAVFEYSWQLLTKDEQQSFASLAVFRSPFTHQTAQQVASITLEKLANLLDKSLIHRLGDSNQFEILPVLHQFAFAKLQATLIQWPTVRQQHTRHYSEWVAQNKAALQGAGQPEALQRLSQDIADIRFAWQWAIAEKAPLPLDQAQHSLFLYYYIRSQFQEGQGLFRSAATALAQNEGTQTLYAQLLAKQGWFTFLVGQPYEAKALLEKSLVMLRPAGNLYALCFTLNYLAAVIYRLGESERAIQLCEESLILSVETNDRYDQAIANNLLSQIASGRGDYGTAYTYAQNSLALEQALNNRWSMGFSLTNLGKVAVAQKAYDEATDYFQRALAIRETQGDMRGQAMCQRQIGETRLAQGKLAQAKNSLTQSLALYTNIGDSKHMRQVAETLTQLAKVR